MERTTARLRASRRLPISRRNQKFTLGRKTGRGNQSRQRKIYVAAIRTAVLPAIWQYSAEFSRT